MRKYRFFIIAAACLLLAPFSSRFLGFLPWPAALPILLGVLFAIIGAVPLLSQKPLSEKELAAEFAGLVGDMVRARSQGGVFIEDDGWWQFAYEKNGEPASSGAWTYDEAVAMINAAMKLLFDGDHLKKQYLPSHVKAIAIYENDGNVCLGVDYR